MAVKIVVAAVACLMVAAFVFRSRGIWREPLARQRSWGVREESARDLARVAPVSLSWLITVALDLTVTAIGGSHRLLSGIVGVVGIAVLGLAAAVYLFNRPAWAVPPTMRDEPGVLKRRRG